MNFRTWIKNGIIECFKEVYHLPRNILHFITKKERNEIDYFFQGMFEGMLSISLGLLSIIDVPISLLLLPISVVLFLHMTYLIAEKW